MRSSIVLLMSLFSLFSHAQDTLPTEVFCGKISSVSKVGRQPNGQFNIKVKISNVQSGLQNSENGKIVLDLNHKKITRTLYSTRYETYDQQSLPIYAFELLKLARASKYYVCISFPLSRKAFESGFPHEFGLGKSVDSAVMELESR